MPVRLGRLEALYVWYGLTAATLMLCYGGSLPGRWAWIAGHVGLVVPAVLLSRLRNAWPRYLAALVLVPTAFTTLGTWLPDVVPEPFEWRLIPANAAVGGEAVQGFFASPPPWLVETCQVCYATFYLLPLALALCFGLERRWGAVRHTTVLIPGGFLLSYLGYLCWPTLPPYRFLSYPAELAGGPGFRWLNPLLYEAEALRQDCMPSGHTMMTLLAFLLAWRYSRRQLLWLGPIGGFLILGTLVLRYHWWIDLCAALPFTALAWVLFEDRAARADPAAPLAAG
ncbi:MAG: phosphatase PAP2 family protein [Planctomycetota bacterium]